MTVTGGLTLMCGTRLIDEANRELMSWCVRVLAGSSFAWARANSFLKGTVKSTPSVQTYARVGGVLYLIIIVAAIFAEVFVRSKLTVSGDASATAANILASEFLFRSGIAAELLVLLCDVALALIFFVLLRPVSKNLALMAAFLRVVMAAISGVNVLNHFDALMWLQASPYAVGIDPALLQTMAYHALKTHAYGFHVALVFFGVYCLILGILIRRSGYLPKILGSLMAVAGVCYLINSFATFLAPDIAGKLGIAILLPPLVAEVSLALWMMIKGVDLQKWRSREDRQVLEPSQ